MSISAKIVAYLHALPQFAANIDQEECVDLRTGIRVSVPGHPGDAEQGLLIVRYPDGRTSTVIGVEYAKIHVVEACRYWCDLGQAGDLRDEVRHQLEHFARKTG